MTSDPTAADQIVPPPAALDAVQDDEATEPASSDKEEA